MPDLAIELYAVEHLAALAAMNVTNLADAKSALGPTERGLDVVFDFGGRRIGVQHTISHGDEGHNAGKRGSLGRAGEEAAARQTQAPFGVWGVADYRAALALRLHEKCAIAALHDNDDVVTESWLVVSSGLPRWGAAASTMIFADLVRTDDMNALCHACLAPRGSSVSSSSCTWEASCGRGTAKGGGTSSPIRTKPSRNGIVRE